MKKITSLLICLISIGAFAQSRYSYTYRLELSDFPSYCFFEMDTATGTVSDTATQLITIKLIERNAEPIMFGVPYVWIILSEKDTLTFFPDDHGLIQTRIPLNGFNLIIKDFYHTDLYTIVPYGTKAVTAVLGKSFRFVIPILRSARPLSEKEVTDIIYDLRNNKNPKLKSKTWFINYEI